MKRILTTLALLGLTFGSPLVAQEDEMNYQGYLTDSGGNPLADGEYTLSFNIYDAPTDDAPTGSSLIWGPFVLGGAGSQGSKANLAGGVFNVVLGPKDNANRDLFEAFSAPNRYLGITVGSNPEISPRQQVLAAPRAMQATRADHANTATAVGDPGDTTIYVASGSVGIGESNPSAKLDVDGTTELNGNLSVSGTATIESSNGGKFKTFNLEPGNGKQLVAALQANSGPQMRFQKNSGGFFADIGLNGTNDKFVIETGDVERLTANESGVKIPQITGPENDGGETAALKIVVPGTGKHMLLDDNEIDTINSDLHLNKNSGSPVSMIKESIQFSAADTGTIDQSHRIFFDESNSNDNYGFSLAYAGTEEPVIDGAKMKNGLDLLFQPVSNTNTFGIYRHNDSIDGEASLTIARSSGEVTVYNGLTEYFSSDRRVKENIEKVEGSLDKLCRLRPVHYDYTGVLKKPGERKRTGFIAQELNEVFPEMVYIGQNRIDGEVIDDFHKINTEALEPHLVVGVQELAAENATLKERLATMEKEMASLTQIVSTLQEASTTPVAQN